MLKSMPRPSAEQPNVRRRRMPVHDEMSIRSLFVLADTRLHQGCVLQGREAKANIFANVFEGFLMNHTLAVGRVESRTASVVRDLKPAPPAPRNAIAKASAMIAPYRQILFRKAIISGRRAKEEDILLGRLHEVSNRQRE